jgi:hypothetical protein
MAGSSLFSSSTGDKSGDRTSLQSTFDERPYKGVSHLMLRAMNAAPLVLKCGAPARRVGRGRGPEQSA